MLHNRRNYGEFRKLIQEIALTGVEGAKPVNVVYGKVTSSSPLEIWLNQAITLDKEHLVLSRGVTDFETEVEFTEDMSGVKKVKVHNSLKVGEKVVLLQLQGGQRFLVVDRVVGV